MKNAVLMLAGAVVAGIVLTLTPLNAQPAAEKPSVQKWEYLVDFHEKNLKSNGEEGFELVTVTETEGSGGEARRFYFKRPMP